jgi:hypothetical protein
MGLFPRLELQEMWAGSRGEVMLPGSIWSALIWLRSVKGCLQMWHCVAVALMYARCLR